MNKLETLFRDHYKGTSEYEGRGKLGDQFDRAVTEIAKEIAPLLADKSKKDDIVDIVTGHMNSFETLAFCAGFRYAVALLADK